MLAPMDFSPQAFFDLDRFAHPSLFEGGIVWEALNKIGAFLQAFKNFKIEIDIPVGVTLVNKERIAIGKGSIVEPGAYIKGPCILGEGCEVRHGAYIRGDLIAGKGCVIGHDTEVKHCILLDEAKAAHFAYLGDSILGNQVNLGAGTVLANLRLDHANVVIKWKEGRLETGMKKLGAIIGDRSQLGCNSVTNPGTLIGKEVFGYPCINFGGVIPSSSLVKPSQEVLISSHD